jgi:hypothetical protein
MSCNTCPNFYPLPTCLEELHVPGLPIETAVKIYIKNHTTGYLGVYDVTTDDQGVAVITPLYPVPDHDFELYATLPGVNERLTFTIDDIDYTCARFTYYLVHDSEGALPEYAEMTLTPVV